MPLEIHVIDAFVVDSQSAYHKAQSELGRFLINLRRSFPELKSARVTGTMAKNVEEKAIVPI